MIKGFWNILVSYVHTYIHTYIYILQSYLPFYLCQIFTTDYHCHKIDWYMVNGKNKVLTVLLNINVSYLENAIYMWETF